MTTPPPRRYDTIAPLFPEGPIDLTQIIPGAGPLELDIGFGRGISLLGRARAEPETRVIGVEIKAKWAYLVEERRKREGLENARAFRGDAREILGRAGPQASLRRVFLHFPDPWWKKRHAKRRVLESGLLDDLSRLLEPGGELFVQTDVEDRAHLYAGEIAAHADFGEVERLLTNPYAASNREMRAEQDGLPIYRLLAKRR